MGIIDLVHSIADSLNVYESYYTKAMPFRQGRKLRMNNGKQSQVCARPFNAEAASRHQAAGANRWSDAGRTRFVSMARQAITVFAGKRRLMTALVVFCCVQPGRVVLTGG